MPAIKVPANTRTNTRLNTRTKTRPKPTAIRHSLGSAFLETLEQDFWDFGPQLIAKLRERRPLDYLKLIVTLLPEELLIERAIEEMTDEELATALDALRPIVTAKLAATRQE